jgi:ATP-dependent RNA helicase SUPV3L1/SUV3
MKCSAMGYRNFESIVWKVRYCQPICTSYFMIYRRRKVCTLIFIRFLSIVVKAKFIQAEVSDLFPYFYRYVKQIYPHIVFMVSFALTKKMNENYFLTIVCNKFKDDLKNLSDLTEPAKWYPEARSIKRKIYYHCGPTNSGKTHTAVQRFRTSATGIYCSPLKLLANEVATRINQTEEKQICDLITGDDKQLVNADGTRSTHTACTVEMADLSKRYEVAVIDEIQMIQDYQRGWVSSDMASCAFVT